MARAVQHHLPDSPEQNSSHPHKWSRFSGPGSSCTRFCSWFPIPPVQGEPRTLRTSSEQVGGIPPAADFAQGDLGYWFPQLYPVEGVAPGQTGPLVRVEPGLSLPSLSPVVSLRGKGLFMKGITVPSFLRRAI